MPDAIGRSPSPGKPGRHLVQQASAGKREVVRRQQADLVQGEKPRAVLDAKLGKRSLVTWTTDEGGIDGLKLPHTPRFSATS